MVKKILVVDDEKDILTTIKNILEYEGYEVTAEIDSRKAVLLSAKNEYDLIILDVLMPFSGEETAKLIRKGVKGNPKIVFCTVVARPDVNMEGINGFIEKPIDPKRFAAQVKKFV
ncbi:response regulator transcription factor [archaeon]|jgi:two-component system, OmpR family, copper resistance phosphate regulon response regulator CusR|nr:response regulator transcription factor [archaeon]